MIGRLFKRKQAEEPARGPGKADPKPQTDRAQRRRDAAGDEGGNQQRRGRRRGGRNRSRNGSGNGQSPQASSRSTPNSPNERADKPGRNPQRQPKKRVEEQVDSRQLEPGTGNVDPAQNDSAGNNTGNEDRSRNRSRRNRGGRRRGNGERQTTKQASNTAPEVPVDNSQTDNQSWSPDQFQVPPVEGKIRFHDLGLSDTLLHGIQDIGFQYCSPIQAQALPHALVGHDVLGKAQTGTGKTAAFLVTVIEDLLKNPWESERFAGEVRALIIAPTRELVMQIGEDAEALCKHTGLNVHTLVGGMDYGKQQRHLHEALADILVATPGRLLDFCGNGDVHLDQVEILVIDEADRMLDMGFIPQVRRIVRQTPRKTHRQTLLFSATFSDDVLRLAEQWMLEPVSIEIEPESVATDSIEQHVYLSSGDDKFTLLYNILQRPGIETLIVFANRRDECRDLHARLRAHGIRAGLLSGEIAQNKRVKTLEDFKSGKLQVLVATDVAGRGIHINDVSHVVNFTLPEEPEDYVHRIGRTGRAGKTGVSISFACEDDAFRLPAIEELLGDKLPCEQPPEDLLVAIPEVEGGGPTERRRSRGGPRGGSSRGGPSGGNRRGGRRPSGNR